MVGAVAGGTAIVTVIVALISAGTTWITTKYVEIPKNRESIDIQKKANELAKNKFQLESLQKALQAKSPEDRARSLGLLVDMKLIDIPSAKVDEFIKKPEIVPQWVVEPSVAASDAAKNSTPKAEQKTLPKSR